MSTIIDENNKNFDPDTDTSFIGILAKTNIDIKRMCRKLQEVTFNENIHENLMN